MLLLIFSVWLGWLPVGGRQTVSLTGETSLWDRIQHLILPVAVLSFGPIAFFSRIMRTETLEVIHTDYVRTARAKGLAPNQVWFTHALRNALIPLMTVMGPAIVGVLGGAVVTETIFAWPGMGRLTINAVFQQDYPAGAGRRHVLCRADDRRLLAVGHFLRPGRSPRAPGIGDTETVMAVEQAQVHWRCLRRESLGEELLRAQATDLLGHGAAQSCAATS